MHSRRYSSETIAAVLADVNILRGDGQYTGVPVTLFTFVCLRTHTMHKM